jgi:hypothetical protein
MPRSSLFLLSDHCHETLYQRIDLLEVSTCLAGDFYLFLLLFGELFGFTDKQPCHLRRGQAFSFRLVTTSLESRQYQQINAT